MASIYTRGKYYWIKYTIAGVMHRESLRPLRKGNSKDKKLAETVLAQKTIEETKFFYNPIVAKLLPVTYTEAKQIFLDSKKNLRQKTIDSYDNALIVFEHYLNNAEFKITSITTKLMEEYEDHLRERNLSENTITSYFKQLSIFFVYLMENKYINSNPVKRTYKRIRMPVTTIPDQDMKIILNYLKKKNIEQYRFVQLCRLTGLRTGEAVDLTWKDFDFTNNVLNIRNTKANRIDPFPLYPALLKFIKIFKQIDDKVFTYPNNRQLRWWEYSLKQIGLDGKYSLHDLRRTFGTEMSHKVNAFELQRLMRHEDIRTTQKYYLFIDMAATALKM
jgi:integrase/recombinase XerD